MVRGSLTSLGPLLYKLTLYETLNWQGSAEGGQRILPETRVDVQGWLKVAKIVADDFEMVAVYDRIAIINRRLEKEQLRWDDVATEFRVLRETIEACLQNRLIYCYPDEQAKVLMRWKADWNSVLKNFPSAQKDIFSAVDCWALGHGTASVFHSMRILEYGIASLAQDVGRKIEVQTWQNIIDQIESEVRNLGKKLPSGVEKADRLRFLSEAVKEIVYFKDGWRNYVAHNRAIYDQHQARSVLEHVRTFMTTLSSRLSEEGLQSS